MTFAGRARVVAGYTGVVICGLITVAVTISAVAPFFLAAQKLAWGTISVTCVKGP